MHDKKNLTSLLYLKLFKNTVTVEECNHTNKGSILTWQYWYAVCIHIMIWSILLYQLGSSYTSSVLLVTFLCSLEVAMKPYLYSYANNEVTLVLVKVFIQSCNYVFMTNYLHLPVRHWKVYTKGRTCRRCLLIYSQWN